MVKITGGDYRPLYNSKNSDKQKVADFYLDVNAVNNLQFYQFVNRYPQWQKKNIAAIFSEDLYLSHWQQKDAVFQPNESEYYIPVTQVSWFAAQAYCQSINKRLPLVSEWEYTARASEVQVDGSKEKGYNQRILNWYSRPVSKPINNSALTSANYWGVKAMHGVIWEWTEDFNSALVNGESRNDSSIDSKLFCGAGAAGAADPSDYAAFMRFGFRSSLQAKFTLKSLGFRCAKSKE